ncbi:MAG: Heavy-metal-associated domain [Firmicutes bacterium]|nr:Heavy-metal-associated domain [Bacillota bacterium]
MCKSCGCHGGTIEKVTIVVKDANGGHSANTIERAVRGLPGVMAAEADMASGRLQVDFDPVKTPLQEIEAALADAGCSVIESIATGHYHPGNFHIGQGVKEYVQKLWMSWS